MRRGHPGIGRWRNENPRHYRPRIGGTPHFKPRHAILEIPRFPPPVSRPHRDLQPFDARQSLVTDYLRPEHHDRNKYRLVNQQNIQYESHERINHPGPRNRYPPFQRSRHSSDHSNSYNDMSNYYENANDNQQCHINRMGDIDHRQPFHISQNRESVDQHQSSNWSNVPIENKKQNYDDRSHYIKPYRHHDDKIPLLGHRPPSSDYYGGNSGSVIDSTNSFSRSIDDTVSIVRKRLLNRNESQNLAEQPPVDQNQPDNGGVREQSTNIYHNQEQPMKKRTQRQKQNVKLNCDKIKNNIVHQLFKMEKGKIHKLMDNPSSSTKFEYAISSLITESQNSLNRHLRSVAEKSLCNSSTEFIHDDNNTIYEDTFMKQMQCILDPQDTVLLEDIKPIVMAELNKVLQLDNFEIDDQATFQSSNDEQTNYDQYTIKSYDYEDYSHNSTHYYPREECDSYPEQSHLSQNSYERSDNSKIGESISRTSEYNQLEKYADSKPMFERRSIKDSCDYSQNRRHSSENSRHSRLSVENKSNEDNFKGSETPPPLFDTNIEQLSEEEDPFAELDKQYHVAVDHNFIENDDVTSPHTSGDSRFKSPIPKEILQSPDNNSYSIKKELDLEIENTIKSPLKSCSPINNKNKIDAEIKSIHHSDFSIDRQNICVNNEPSYSFDIPKLLSTSTNCGHNTQTEVLDTVIQEGNPESKDIHEKTEKLENSNNVTKHPIPYNARKRSVENQRPSHRKEKRKKTECNQADSNKQILNKNIIINVNDCAAKTSEKCDSAKSIFNLFFSKDENTKEMTKDNKKIESSDKVYSDKYEKRKESPNKPKQKVIEIKKKRNSSSSIHSIQSPKDKNNTGVDSKTPTKTEAKTKLKPIDMFVEQPRKVNIHQAHRNTAIPPSTVKKSIQENKSRVMPTSIPTVTKRHVATQVIKKSHSKEAQTFESNVFTSRFCQTELKKFAVKAIQTDPVSFGKSGLKSTDAFERMKEIDLEIQVLLQEKFKLYNSLESKDTCSNTIQALGMTVLNVTPFEETKESDTTENILTEDTIVEEFTNMPVEELEQIALETVEEETELPKIDKSNRRQKPLQPERRNSQSPSAKARGNKKAKTPNISLIEQIITDDRPLEDIISLDDLEAPIAKNKKKTKKSQIPKKKVTKRTKTIIPTFDKSNFPIRECSVVLLREDLSKYLKQKPEPALKFEPALEQENDIIEESVENDIQFDMLDVSEDIVIGESCEVKSMNDKDIGERIEVPVNEEIILDNSQSSAEDVLAPHVGHSDNECRMFDYSADDNLRRDSVIVTGNADAVLAIECIDNNFIAACLDGNVYYYSGDGQLLSTLRGSNLAVTCLTVVKDKYETTVYTGSLDSRIRYYDLETGLEKGPECNVLSPIQTMDRAWDTVFVGTRTGFVLQFECKNNMLIPVSTVKFSEQSILALRAMKEGPRKVLLVAARSENVTIKDAQTGLLLRTLSGPKMTVYTLLYEDGKVYCGTSSHQIHVFDYTSGGHVGTHEGGKGAVCLRAAGGLLFAGCYDGCVYVYREGEGRPFAQLRGPSLMLLSLAIVDTKIIAGYKDRSLYIWKIPLSILQEMIL